MSAIFSSFFKTVASADTPEALGAATVLFNCAHFIGQKAEGTDNAGVVRIDTGSAAFEIYPGVGEAWTAPVQSYVTAAQFNVAVANDGDGVLCLYALADFKAFSDIESTIEDAFMRYLRCIGATLDDCSFTTGISQDERTEDNINVYCGRAERRGLDTGALDCAMTVQVRTAVGKAGEENRLDRHRMRVAYVRDLVLDPDCTEIVSSVSHKLHVYANSVREIVAEQRIEGRQWVADLTFTCTAQTSALK